MPKLSDNKPVTTQEPYKSRILWLADTIEQNPKYFNLTDNYACGTEGCIAGFAEWLAVVEGYELPYNESFDKQGREIKEPDHVQNCRYNAQEYLGLTYEQARDLFTGQTIWPHIFSDTAKERKENWRWSIKTLRQIAKRGAEEVLTELLNDKLQNAKR